MKKFIYSLLLLVLIGFSLYFLIREKKEKIVNTTEDSYKNEYVVYKNSLYGREFTYPKSWGEVVVKEGNKICPEEDSYRTADTLNIFDQEFSFYEKKLSGSESFIQTGIRIYELDREKLNNCGDDFHLKIAQKEIDPRTISSFILNPITTINGLSGIYNMEASRLDTESRVQYTFYILENSRIYILQPYMSFIPYFGSKELNEMEQEFEGNMTAYIEKGDTAENIRLYLEEFKKMVESLKIL